MKENEGVNWNTMNNPIHNKELQKIAVIGLGKLGACIAACLAERGFDVIGTDVDVRKVEQLRQGKAPVDEPKLQETIEQGASRLRATTNVRELVENSEAAFFIVPTPSLPDGSFNNEFLLKAVRQVAEYVRDLKKRNYLFVINSTVTPGSCDEVFGPMLEQVLNGKWGQDFGVCYNPEFIALGDVIKGLLAPDFVLMGESDKHSGDALEQLYRRFCTNAAPVQRMSIVNAELTKISVNCAVTMKISFVNQLSGVCSKIPGADAHVILRALGNDRRIGKEYLKPGLGFGGPCFPRDNRLFQYIAKKVGASAPLAEATDRVNEAVNDRLLQTVLSHAKDKPVSILGLAYKPFSNVTECSPGIWLCEQLAQRKQRVFVHDYMVTSTELNGVSKAVQFCADPAQLVKMGASTLVVTCPWPGYKDLFSPNVVESLANGTTVIDPWLLLDGIASNRPGVNYLSRLS
jgi:UDPglucose 6-dehydrogenase